MRQMADLLEHEHGAGDDAVVEESASKLSPELAQLTKISSPFGKTPTRTHSF
jgi:hypothetical protein